MIIKLSGKPGKKYFLNSSSFLNGLLYFNQCLTTWGGHRWTVYISLKIEKFKIPFTLINSFNKSLINYLLVL